MLDDNSRQKLDGIVQQMTANGEPDQNIQAVVDDFKQKYGTKGSQPAHGDGVVSPWAASSPTDSPAMSGAKTLANIVPSAINTGVGIAKMATGVQAAENIAQIPDAAKGVLDTGQYFHEPTMPAFMRNANSTPATAFSDPLARTEAEVPGALADTLVPKAVQGASKGIYGAATGDKQMSDAGFRQAQEGVVNDPVGTILPFLLIGREAAGQISPEARAAFDSGVSKVAGPVTGGGGMIGKGAGATFDFAGALGRKTVKNVTGLDATTVKNIIDDPKSYSPEKIANTSRISIASDVKDAIDAKRAEVSDQGSAYNGIRASNMPIKVAASDLTDIIQGTTGLKFEPEAAPAPAKASLLPTIQMDAESAGGGSFVRTTSGSVLSSGDIAKINQFYKVWQPRFEAGQLTPNEFLNMRSELGKIANYEGIGKSTTLESAADRMRGTLNSKYREQVPGLGDSTDKFGQVTPGLDTRYGSKAQDLESLSNGLLDNDGNLRDSDINKIANATGKSRAILLQQLEDLVPGITRRINMLKAIEDIRDVEERHKVGTYKSSVTGIAGGGAMLVGLATMNPWLIAGGIAEAVITNPSVAVPMLRAYGFSKSLVTATVARLGAMGGSVNQLPQGAPTILGSFGPRLNASKAP